MRLFQQFYIYQWSDRKKKAKQIIEQMEGLRQPGGVISAGDPFSLVYAVTYATWLYRNKDTWAFEKMLQEEAAASMGKIDYDHQSERDFKKVITALIPTLPKGELSKHEPMYKVLVAALFRLDELLLIKGDQAETPQSEWENVLEKLLQRQHIRGKNKRLYAKGIKIEEEGSAIYVLNMAYWLAQEIKETHRALDALQCIATARYFRGDTLQDKTENYKKEQAKILETLHDKVRRQLKNDHNYPIIRAKLELVEGDIYFSNIFKLEISGATKGQQPFTPIAHLRYVSESQDQDTQKNHQRDIQKNLHRMIKAYLHGLNALAIPDLPYETFHFHNMTLEINRRILMIRDREMLRLLAIEIERPWPYLSNLKGKSNLLTSILQDIALHEVSLLAQEAITGTANASSSTPTPAEV